MGAMTTVVLGERPAELQEIIERRQRLGQDRFDEVWDGVYHMSPHARASHGSVDDQLGVLLRPFADAAGLDGTTAFNLGEAHNFRVPDHGYHRSFPSALYLPTAAIVVEVVSPDDESYEKFGFYAAHGVEELIYADPQLRSVRIWALRDGEYAETGESALLGVTAARLAGDIDWPPDA
jgi:Uma2 family endonuclease